MATGNNSAGPFTVPETADQGLLAVAKSLIEEADPPFFAKSEGVQAREPLKDLQEDS